MGWRLDLTLGRGKRAPSKSIMYPVMLLLLKMTLNLLEFLCRSHHKFRVVFSLVINNFGILIKNYLCSFEVYVMTL